MSYQRIPAESENKDQNVEMQSLGPVYPPQQIPVVGHQGFVSHLIVPQAHVIVTPPAPSPEELETTLKTRRVDFDSQRYISEGWRFAKHNCCSILQIMLVLALVMIATHVVSFLLLRGIYGDDMMEGWHGTNSTNEDPDSMHMRLFRNQFKRWHDEDEEMDGDEDDEEDDDMEDGYIVGFMIMGLLQGLLVFGPLTAGGFMTVFEAMRNNAKMKWRSLFSAFQCPYYRRLLPLNLMLVALKWLGFELFVIPGILFSIFSCFALPLHSEHRFLTGWRAIKHSFWVTRKHFCSLVCFFLLLILLNFIGLLALGFGVLVTAPVSFFAFCYCYAHLVGVNGVSMMVPVSSTTPPTPQFPQQTQQTQQPQPTQTQLPQPTQTQQPQQPQQSYLPPPIATPVAPSHYVMPSAFAPQYSYQMMATPVQMHGVPMATSPTTSQLSQPVQFSQPVQPATPVATAVPSVPIAQGPINYPSSLYPAQYPVINRA